MPCVRFSNLVILNDSVWSFVFLRLVLIMEKNPSNCVSNNKSKQSQTTKNPKSHSYESWNHTHDTYTVRRLCECASLRSMRVCVRSPSLLLDTVTYILCKGDRTCLLDRIYCWPLLLLLLLLLHSFHSCVHCVNLLWYVCALTLTHCTHQHWHCVVVIYCRQRYFPFERMAFAAKSQAFNAHIHLHTCTQWHIHVRTLAILTEWKTTTAKAAAAAATV